MDSASTSRLDIAIFKKGQTFSGCCAHINKSWFIRPSLGRKGLLQKPDYSSWERIVLERWWSHCSVFGKTATRIGQKVSTFLCWARHHNTFRRSLYKIRPLSNGRISQNRGNPTDFPIEKERSVLSKQQSRWKQFVRCAMSVIEDHQYQQSAETYSSDLHAKSTSTTSSRNIFKKEMLEKWPKGTEQVCKALKRRSKYRYMLHQLPHKLWHQTK